MMDFVINGDELEAICGLPHIQQLTYLRGIRPYMDVKTGLVGVKRRISHQSISEQLYVEPHQGIKSQSFSRDQVRRAVSGLVRAGLIEVQSEGMHLILKCLLASQHYSVQNKAAINPPQKATIKPREESLENTGLSEVEALKADTEEPPKAAIPHKDNYYIYLLSQFEKFWSLYPEKKSKNNAQAVFEELKPNAELFHTIINALNAQINHRETMKLQGTWVPPWKYPANWLAQRCWEDELPKDALQEKHHAEHTKILVNVTPQKTCSAHPVMSKSEGTMSSSSKDTFKAERRIDLLFSKFAAFYGHVWRSQFKDEVFLKFAKKEWQEALVDFTDAVLTKAILNCREFYELPPTLPQMLYCCRQIRKQESFYVVKDAYHPANKAIVSSCLQKCKELLAK